MTQYELDQDLQEDTYQQTGGRENRFVQLPFEVPIIYWKHGDPEVIPDANKNYPITHYGRWNCGIEDFTAFAERLNLDVPEDVEKRPKKDRSGNVISGEFYEVVAWRSLIFAVVAQRSRWYKNRKGKNLSHMQVLVQLADSKKKGKKKGKKKRVRKPPVKY